MLREMWSKQAIDNQSGPHISWQQPYAGDLHTCSPCRAKLASLFGLDQEGSQGNESFQYTAPKQPRKTSSPGRTIGAERSLTQDIDLDFRIMSVVCLQRQPARNQPPHRLLLQCCLLQQCRPSDSKESHLPIFQASNVA